MHYLQHASHASYQFNRNVITDIRNLYNHFVAACSMTMVTQLIQQLFVELHTHVHNYKITQFNTDTSYSHGLATFPVCCLIERRFFPTQLSVSSFNQFLDTLNDYNTSMLCSPHSISYQLTICSSLNMWLQTFVMRKSICHIALIPIPHAVTYVATKRTFLFQRV